MQNEDLYVRRFASVNLVMNISRGLEACNPGGSVICAPGSKGCDVYVNLTCSGKSCSGTSRDVVEPVIEAVIEVEQSELEALRIELQNVVRRYTDRSSAN